MENAGNGGRQKEESVTWYDKSGDRGMGGKETKMMKM